MISGGDHVFPQNLTRRLSRHSWNGNATIAGLGRAAGGLGCLPVLLDLEGRARAFSVGAACPKAVGERRFEATLWLMGDRRAVIAWRASKPRGARNGGPGAGFGASSASERLRLIACADDEPGRFAPTSWWSRGDSGGAEGIRTSDLRSQTPAASRFSLYGFMRRSDKEKMARVALRGCRER
jgi:hypothetical protein